MLRWSICSSNHQSRLQTIQTAAHLEPWSRDTDDEMTITNVKKYHRRMHG